ncbi:phospholipase D-like domain-containing protein [Salinirarus marinus]|uniref:phospholipase D-like domain-containing protein n=1 Tax=Salinirarus marinus TaxID=3068310 RepID=UPI003C6C0600
MFRQALVVLVVVSAVVAPVSAQSSGGVASDAGLVGAYPNPSADGDVGEFVVVRLPPDSSNWSLTDGETVVSIPDDRPARTVAVATDPSTAETIVRDLPVVDVSSLALSNAGETLTLRRNGVAVATLAYEDAPEGERVVRRDGETRWRPIGLDVRDPHAFGAANATAFVLPDSPAVPVETLRRADERILLAGYTFASERVATALVDAARRGVRVRVLVEGEPVGGISATQAAVLDRLVAAGVPVAVVAGDRARFRFHHAKYAVADDRALVMTENWKPAGVGGRSSRGWGVVVRSAAVATDLASLFEHDADGRDTVPWEQFRAGRAFEESALANDSYPANVDPRGVRADRVTVLTAPGNAERALVARIDRADSRVAVVQPTIGGRETPLLQATLRAAERGVEVRILLSGAWYVAEENRRLVEQLNRRADRRDLPLRAKVATPDGRFEKIHAKGLVVDDAVAVGSLNWNRVSAGGESRSRRRPRRGGRRVVLPARRHGGLEKRGGRNSRRQWPSPSASPSSWPRPSPAAGSASTRISRATRYSTVPRPVRRRPSWRRGCR